MILRVIIEDEEKSRSYDRKILLEKNIEISKDQIHAIAMYWMKNDPVAICGIKDPFIEACVLADYLIE